jgi:hypothetical protein
LGKSSLAGGVVVNGETLPCDFVIMGVRKMGAGRRRDSWKTVSWGVSLTAHLWELRKADHVGTTSGRDGRVGNKDGGEAFRDGLRA